MNSWCKVLNNQVVDGPRAWDNDTPPDESWRRHFLVTPEHTIHDNFIGSRLEIRDNGVAEVKIFEPKTQEQIDSEVDQIKKMAAEEVSFAETQIAADVENKDQFIAHRDAWSLLLNITDISDQYIMPRRPAVPNSTR